MNRSFAVLAALAALGVAACASGPTREQDLVNRAVGAMGGAKRLAEIQSVSARGSSKQWDPEQSDVPGGAFRFANDSTYEVWQDRSQRAARYDIERKFAYPAPRTFKFSEIVTPDAGYVLGIDSNGRNAQSQKMTPPAHSMSGLRLAASQREALRATASGLLMAMRANPAELKPSTDMVVAGSVVLPTVGYGPYLVGFDAQTGLPALVRTLDYDNIWGDVNYDVIYSDWREVGGVKVPMSRRYEMNGRLLQEVTLTDVQWNPPVDASKFEVPAALRADAARPATGNVPYQWVIRRQFIGVYLDSDNTSFDTRSSKGLVLNELAPGLFHVTGGSHNTLLVEMSDHLVVVDAPVSDAQSLWVVNQARTRFPGKPIKWVALTHHHMDHAGGIRGYLAQQPTPTLIVGQGAREHFRKALASPMTRNPDMKPADFSQVPIMEVPDSHVISDSRGRQVVLYAMQDNPHAKGLLMAYVPDARLGFVTDVWSPGTPMPDKPNPALMSVVNTVKRAGIQPERFAGGHGSVAPYSTLTKVTGQ
jgi:glyoxylase-like metal-dependent hydrolase (beta-lactamase superfamily II)